MRMRAGLLLTGLAGLGGCTEDRPRVTVRFEWTDGAQPTADDLVVEAEVVAPDGQRTPSDPVAFRPGARVFIEKVPIANGLIVEVRLRDGLPAGTIRYFGRSPPFDFDSGSRTVRVTMDVAPQLAEGDAVPLVVVDSHDGRVSMPEVELEVVGRGFDALEVAQDFLFEQGRIEILDPVPIEVRPDGLETHRIGYDLNAARADCSPDDGRCDGPREIFVRGRRAALTSPFQSVRIVLDTTPPRVSRAAVSYVPVDENPLSTVTKAGSGTAIAVTVVFDEAVEGVGEPPMLQATNRSASLVFERAGPLESEVSSVVFMAVVDADAHVSGTYRPLLTARDLVGNLAADLTFESPSIEVDVDTEALEVDQDRVSYLRAPIGRSDPEGLHHPDGTEGFEIPAGPAYFALAPRDGLDPSRFLDASAFRFTSGAALGALRVWSDDQRQGLLATVRPQADGRWDRADLRLPGSDHPSVYVTGLDDAGNESEPVRIENAWFIGSSAAPPGEPTPHGLFTSSAIRPPLGARIAVSDRTGLDSPSAGIITQVARPRWRERAVFDHPTRTGRHSMATDWARGRVVAYGGVGLTDPWEWNGSRWLPTAPLTQRPPPLRGFGMAYDAARGRTVIFGGFGSGEEINGRTWEWDGARWFDVTPPSGNPPPRALFDMAYDSRRGRVVLFGGIPDVDAAYLTDVWEWDGSAWHEAKPTGPSPRGRLDHVLAYDAARERTVLYGGWSFGPIRDTWEWDGARWAERTSDRTLDPAPERRSRAAMAYDARRQVVVLFGGLGEQNALLSDTWEWDGSLWSKASTATPTPEERFDASLAYDPSLGGVILFGGTGINDYLADTWIWDGHAWSRLDVPPDQAPPKRAATALWTDPDTDELFIFGGHGSRANFDLGEPRRDAWSFDGRTWSPQDLGPGPSARGYAAHALDPATGTPFLFGGLDSEGSVLNDVWRLEGAAWTALTVDPGPPALDRPAAAYDEARGRVVLFGGWDGSRSRYSRETWEWDGAAWDRVSLAGPPARNVHAMAYDAARERVVLFGGFGSSGRHGDTWEWNGEFWTDVTPAGPSPFPRNSHSMAYDPRRRATVLFGGFADGRELSDVWTWDGTRWREITPSGVGPSPRGYGALSHVPVHGNLVLFGGWPGFFEVLADTWELQPTGRAAIQFSPVLPEDLARERLHRLHVRAFCGGRSATSGGATSGAELAGWSGQGGAIGWSVVGETQAGAAVDGLIEHRSAAPAEVRGHFLERDRTMHWQCRPLGTSAPEEDAAVVELSYIEVRVGYETD